ncbi:MAG: hypothetical protein WCT31_04830 [Candidatus Micrarchaeia archaeon]
MFDKRILMLALLLLFCVSISIMFSGYGISETGYAQLVGKDSFLSSIGPSALKILALLSAFVSSAILFLAITGIGKEHKEHLVAAAVIPILFILSSFVSSNLSFVSSPYSIISLPLFILGVVLLFSNSKFKLAGLIPLVLGLAASYQHISFSLDLAVLSQFPLLIVFASVSLGEYLSHPEKKILPSLISFVLGLVTLPLLPSLSLALLSFSAASSISHLFSKPGRDTMLIFVFFAVFVPALLAFTPLSAFIAGAGMMVLVFFLFSLYYFEFGKLAYYLSIVAIVLSFSMFYLGTSVSGMKVADDATISAFTYAGNNGIPLAILDFPNTYRFYAKSEPIMINGTGLISKSPFHYSYIYLGTQSMANSFAQYPVAFRYLSTVKETDGSFSAVLTGGPFVVAVPVNELGAIVGDGRVYSASTGEFVKQIPFTKLRKLAESIPLQNSKTILLNIDGYEDSQLYMLTLSGTTSFEKDGSKIIRVS